MSKLSNKDLNFLILIIFYSNMKKINKSTIKTKELLLINASAIFAKKGFKNTTVAEICKQAEVNIAAVNYHFKDKENLYNKAIHYSFEKAMEVYPIDVNREITNPIESLRYFISAKLGQVLAQGEIGNFSKLMTKEIAEPTNVLDDVVDNIVLPQTQYVRKIVSAIFDCDNIKDDDIMFCVIQVISPPIFLGFSKPIEERLCPKMGCDKDHNPVNELPDKMTEFIVAGIEQIKKKY